MITLFFFVVCYNVCISIDLSQLQQFVSVHYFRWEALIMLLSYCPYIVIIVVSVKMEVYFTRRKKSETVSEVKSTSTNRYTTIACHVILKKNITNIYRELHKLSLPYRVLRNCINYLHRVFQNLTIIYTRNITNHH